MTRRYLNATRDLNDDSGSVTIMFALFCSVILLSAVVSIDYARAVMVSQKITAALDAAALAGAKLLDTDGASDAEVETRAKNFFNAEIQRIGAQKAILATMLPTVDRATSTVTTKVDATVKTYFGGYVGIQNIVMNKTSSVTYKMRKIELAMALDVTGSMSEVPAGDVRSKIESLQSSATSLVNTLYARAVNDTSVRVALAPYSAGVNVDTYASQVTNGLITSGCVVERPGPNNTTDALAVGGDALVPEPVSGTCPTANIVPLSGVSKVNDITSEISNFTAGGSTAGHLGTAWAWYLVSPKWAGMFPTKNAPAPFSDDVIKSVVIMTDGMFNTSYLGGYAANSQPAIDESYSQYLALCAGMKAQGINVYTVLFGLADPVAEAKMMACASKPGNYFPAANGSQLEASFQQIADKLNNLRISK
jgi:Flp pilus assembly protein TadG